MATWGVYIFVGMWAVLVQSLESTGFGTWAEQVHVTLQALPHVSVMLIVMISKVFLMKGERRKGTSHLKYPCAY